MDNQLIKTVHKSLRSSSSTLVFVYLEELFEKSPNGFYKFHAPCKHPDYKAGTSMSEETGWIGQSLHFRLNKICTLYRSKSLYEGEVDVVGHEAAFRDKPYLRFMDHNTHQIYYKREPRIVANILNGVPLVSPPKTSYHVPNFPNQSCDELLFCA